MILTDYDLAPLITEKILNQFAMASAVLDDKVQNRSITRDRWRTETDLLLNKTAAELLQLFKWQPPPLNPSEPSSSKL